MLSVVCSEIFQCTLKLNPQSVKTVVLRRDMYLYSLLNSCVLKRYIQCSYIINVIHSMWYMHVHSVCSNHIQLPKGNMQQLLKVIITQAKKILLV